MPVCLWMLYIVAFFIFILIFYFVLWCVWCLYLYLVYIFLFSVSAFLCMSLIALFCLYLYSILCLWPLSDNLVKYKVLSVCLYLYRLKEKILTCGSSYNISHNDNLFSLFFTNTMLILHLISLLTADGSDGDKGVLKAGLPQKTFQRLL